VKTTTKTQVDSSERKLDAAYFLRLLMRKGWILVLCVILGTAGAVLYILNCQKIYASRAVIEVEQEAPRVVDIEEINHEEFKAPEEIYTVAQTLMNATLLIRVIKINGLEFDPSFAPPKKDGSKYLDSELVQLFLAKITVTMRKGTRLVDIGVEDPSPARAQALAQSLVDEFMSQSIEQKFSVARGANDALLQEAERLKTKLEHSEEALQLYREKYHAVSLEEKQNIIVEKLKELNQKVTEASSTRLKLEADVAAIQSGRASSPDELLLLSSVTALPEVVDLRKQLADKQAVFKNEARVRGLQETLNRTLVKGGEMVVKTYEAAKNTEGKLQGALHDQEKAALALDKIAIPYQVLARDVEADRTLYESVLRRMKETNLSERLRIGDVRLIEAPMIAAGPIKPVKRQIVMLGILAALLVGGGILVGTELSDSSIHSVDEAERVFGRPVVAAVPRTKRKNRKEQSAVIADAASYEAESFRCLRTSISLLDTDREKRSTLFTSATPSEGKTYCSLNYAAALAQMGLRTLLIDADLRRPALTRNLLGNSTGGDGLSDCLTGKKTIESCVKPCGIENLFIIGSGQRARRPLELIAASDMGKLLEEALLHFDRLVLDTAPINAVCDTQLIARAVEGIFLVVRAGKTPRRAVNRGLQLLAQAGRAPDGIVLNRLVRRSADSYYSSDYAGGYAEAGV
jgi:polysaccharide biosynthesis transport protein